MNTENINWNGGMMKYEKHWNAGTMEYWNNGMVEYWVKKMNDKNSIFQYSKIPLFLVLFPGLSA